MKILLAKSKQSNLTQGDTKVAVRLNLHKSKPFSGFNYTVAEGRRLAKRSYTEIPGLDTGPISGKVKV